MRIESIVELHVDDVVFDVYDEVVLNGIHGYISNLYKDCVELEYTLDGIRYKRDKIKLQNISTIEKTGHLHDGY